MGTVTGANIIYNSGFCRHLENVECLNFFEETYRVEFEYDYGPHLLSEPCSSAEGMWRYHRLLPLPHIERLYPLPVGNTPLAALPGLRRWSGLPSLWIKDETRSPTGSNKDRATALVLEHALHKNIKTVSCASTGNVAVSLAVGAAASGIRAIIFVPACISDTKLQIMRLAGAKIFKVIEGYEAAVQLSRRAASTFGWYDRNTGYNPLTVEAKKTVALEIWEQLGGQVPEAVVIPVGDGVTFSGIAKGFRELRLCGATNKLPRLIGVQAAGCQPLKLAWERNEEVCPAQPATIADGIAVGIPIYATITLRDIRESAGAFLAVSDEAIINAVNVLASQGGILAEPAGAAAFAGVQGALASGLIEQGQTVVALVTGTAFKALHHIRPLPTSAIYQVHKEMRRVMTVLTIVDKSTQGEKRAWSLDFPAETMTLRELIRRRISQEVTEYNAKFSEYFVGLVQPTESERTLNGFRLKTAKKLDWQAQYEKAIEAFTRHSYIVLVNDQQMVNLDVPIEVRLGARVTFFQLVPLVGG